MREIAALAADKKAVDIVTLDLRGVAGYTDYFVICSGNTERQAKAIHDGIHLGLKNEPGCCHAASRASGEARWILMDYLDVVVHVFTPETRDFYRLETLWGDVPRSELDPEELVIELRPGREEAPAREAEGRPAGRPRWSGASRARTGDLLHAMQALSQLSYSPKTAGRPF